ncbi:CcmD family protein [Halogranum amylolyticum]|uniref:CcmD family protein n=1 Tax=Halogranum amylolyticum TaxID=660520 RepID=A0A1H8NK68_9EURY|nr:CcmD family protein [Halogranum amylolyticum]SEO29889.1 CcmD family protein [Halogranum amylolyticum]
MEPLLLAGYSIIFVALFIYIVRLQRRLSRLERKVSDLDN